MNRSKAGTFRNWTLCQSLKACPHAYLYNAVFNALKAAIHCFLAPCPAQDLQGRAQVKENQLGNLRQIYRPLTDCQFHGNKRRGKYRDIGELMGLIAMRNSAIGRQSAPGAELVNLLIQHVPSPGTFIDQLRGSF
jgi:hypothetical protein